MIYRIKTINNYIPAKICCALTAL